jgi:AcrR family transcriptional regulator
MTIPVKDQDRWSSLDAAAKRERILAAAAEVFARDGLHASMPSVAAAAGAGVASLYRQFPSKHELLAALVVRRWNQTTDAAAVALAAEGDRWSALTEMLRTIVERQSADDFLGEARITVAQHPDVRAARDRAMRVLAKVLAAARAEGRLRADATTQDLRLLLAATRAAKRVEPAGRRRMLELMIDALESRT